MNKKGPVTLLREIFKEKDIQNKELKDKYMRALAELDNYRKRMEKEMEESRRFAKVDFFIQILPVLENIDRAINGAGESVAKDSFFQGMEIICRQFKETLRSMGLTEFSALGQLFDPSQHEAIGKLECTDKPENTIVEEISKGYVVGGKVIRPARVIVACLKQEGGCEHAENNRN